MPYDVQVSPDEPIMLSTVQGRTSSDEREAWRLKCLNLAGNSDVFFRITDLSGIHIDFAQLVGMLGDQNETRALPGSIWRIGIRRSPCRMFVRGTAVNRALR